MSTGRGKGPHIFPLSPEHHGVQLTRERASAIAPAKRLGAAPDRGRFIGSRLRPRGSAATAILHDSTVAIPNRGYFGKADGLPRIEGTASGFRTSRPTLNYPRSGIVTNPRSGIVTTLGRGSWTLGRGSFDRLRRDGQGIAAVDALGVAEPEEQDTTLRYQVADRPRSTRGVVEGSEGIDQILRGK